MPVLFIGTGAGAVDTANIIIFARVKFSSFSSPIASDEYSR